MEIGIFIGAMLGGWKNTLTIITSRSIWNYVIFEIITRFAIQFLL